MNKPLLAFAAVVALALAGSAYAGGPATVKVAFPFVVNSTQMPAGTYEILPISGDKSVVELISVGGHAVVNTTTVWGGSVAAKDPTFEFKKYGDAYFLARIDLPGDDVREIAVKPVTVEQVLAKLAAERYQHTQVGDSSQK
jgi:hypothetical protein